MWRAYLNLVQVKVNLPDSAGLCPASVCTTERETWRMLHLVTFMEAVSSCLPPVPNTMFLLLKTLFNCSFFNNLLPAFCLLTSFLIKHPPLCWTYPSQSPTFPPSIPSSINVPSCLCGHHCFHSPLPETKQINTALFWPVAL